MKHHQHAPKSPLERDVRAASVLASPPSLIPAAMETTVFSALLLTLFLGGILGCIVTGFSLPVMPSVLVIGVLVSVWTVLLWNRVSRRIPLLWALLPSLVLLYGHLRMDALRDGCCYLAAGVFRFLCAGYPGLQMPSFLAEHAAFLSQAELNTLLLSSARLPISECFVCIAVVLGILWVILYQNLHAVCICAFLALPPFVLCFLIIETTIPAFWALLALLLYWMLLLFTRSAVRLHMRAAAAQAWVLLIPCILFLSAVYFRYPKETPVGELVRDGYDRVLQVLSTVETTVSNTAGPLFSGIWADVSAEGTEIAFDSLGPRRYLGRTVMRAKGDTAGVVYLRENTNNRR